MLKVFECICVALVFTALFSAAAFAQKPLNDRDLEISSPKMTFKVGDRFDLEKVRKFYGDANYERLPDEGWAVFKISEHYERIFTHKGVIHAFNLSCTGSDLTHKTLSDFSTARGIRLGDPPQKVIDLYGAPAKTETSKSGLTNYIYEKNEIRIQFVIRKGMVGEISGGMKMKD